ncbi:MAG: D-alanyl-D-alanine carboxypeptidase [Bdellovibrio sp.]|nr:D-alanyl-D-alanine carboxypeptidase [Bdellovibrio sp.]
MIKKPAKRHIGFKFYCVFFLCAPGFLGCAPQSNSSEKATKIQLPTRPATNADVFSRNILNQNDPRVSYCEILENNTASYTGVRDTQLEPLASLSKVITSAWAMDTRGLDSRFASEWYLKPVSGLNGIFDAYLRTNYDPVVNTEKLLYFMSELKALGVTGLRELVIDETTRVYISVLSAPHLELKETPVSSDESKDNLKLLFNSKNWASRTLKAKDNLQKWAAQNRRALNIPSSFSVEQVVVKNSAQINKDSYSNKKIILSAPLFKYLKNMNVFSNNYLADALFESFGGASAFKNFQKNTLKISTQDLQIYTGSGLPVNEANDRKDNLGSCFSMIRVLSYVKQVSAQAQFNLGHLLLNPTSDQDGTFETQIDYGNSVVLKTGRLFDNPAFNLAGFVATEKGTLSFVFLGHDFTNMEAHDIENMRSEMLNDIYRNYSTSSDFVTLSEYDIFL